MPTKKSRERYKDRNPGKSQAEADAPQTSLEILKRRRFKRFLFVGIIGLAFPILECIAYQFRAITISITNRSDQQVKRLKVTYDGGAFDVDELKPGGVVTRVIRPDFSFSSKHFATYEMKIRFGLESGNSMANIGRVGAIDFSAKELYTIQPMPARSEVQLTHTTRPGFPLGLVRDLMERLGMG